jgi:putative proteasome-type protease
LTFDFSALIGDQFAQDKEHKLFLVYLEGNWIEVGQGTPYQIIGLNCWNDRSGWNNFLPQDSIRLIHRSNLPHPLDRSFAPRID